MARKPVPKKAQKRRPTTKSKAVAKRTSIGSIVGYACWLGLWLIAGTCLGWVKQSRVANAVFSELMHPRPPEEVFAGDENLTLLLLGCDQVVDEKTKKVLKRQARSDMMLIANLDFRHNKVTGVSIPRDTECIMDGYNVTRINGYHNVAPKGEEAAVTKKAVEFLLPGVTIDRVLTLDYDELIKMVDMVGGVPVDVERDMDYDDNAGKLHIHLRKGYAKLDGADAVGYVRYRHGDTDFDRQKRQKHFLLAFKQQLMHNWTQIGVVADQAGKALGDTLTPTEIASIVLFMRKVKPEDIKLDQLPVHQGKGTRLILDDDGAHDMLAQLNLLH